MTWGRGRFRCDPEPAKQLAIVGSLALCAAREDELA